jgi:18S rRNA (adenine1779-N6/adenine1780-N6)-dimethyltransferase
MPPIRKEKGGKTARTAPYAGTASLPTNKKHGQHLLKNPGIVDKIMTACDLKPSDTVFEIGPGTGNLTMKLLAGAKRVLAYEIDPRMACEVRKRAVNEGRTNLEVHDQDVLSAKWPVFDVCATNLPYQISSPFTFRLLAHRPLFRCAVVMFQKEFAERLIAKVGEKQYGRLAVNTRLFVKVSCVCKVSKGSFNPPPEVDSMVVKFVPRDPPIEVNFREWDGLMRICFGRKNKTLQSSFKTSYTIKMLEDNYKTWCVLTGTTPQKGSVKDLVMEALNACDMADKRAIRIDLDGYFKLLLEFNKRGIHFSNLSAGSKIGDDAEAGKKKDVAIPDESFFDDNGDDGDGGMED